MMMPGDSGAFSQAGDGSGLLRVLSGAQAGAEIALKPRIYIIGSGEDCDVYLAEPALAGAHLALTIDETVSIAARDGAVAIEGRLIQPGESVEVTLPLIVDLGAATLGLGDRETNWRALTVPDLVALQAASAAAEAERAARENETAGEEGEEPAASEDGSEASGEATPEAPAPARPSIHARLRLLLGIACIVMAGVVAFAKQDRLSDLMATTASSADLAAASSEDTGDDSASLAIDRQEQIEEALLGAGLVEVRVERRADDGLALLGFVPDDDARAVLSGIAPDLRDETRNVASMMEALQLALSGFRWPEEGFGEHLDARYDGDGRFVLDGYLGPEVDRTVLRRRLMGDVPGMMAVDFQRASLADWQEILTRRLTDARLAQWISVTPELGRLNVTGELTEREADRWRAVGQAFVTESRGWPRLIINVRTATPPVLGLPAIAPVPEATVVPDPAPPATETRDPQTVDPIVESPVADGPVSEVVQPARRPDFHVIGVIIPTDGSPGRVLLDDGETATEGSFLQNGALVRSVTPTRVVIEIGDQTFEYRVKEPR